MADIHSNILRLTDRTQSLETDFAQKLIELKKAQSLALQTQLNPHFLLNTLQMICFSLIDENHGDTEAVKMISLLSDILRSSLNTRDYMIKLDEELALTEKYPQLELIRSDGGFRTEYDIDPQTRGKRILRFMFQPLLENCVLHGFSQCRKADRTITITTRLEKLRGGEQLTITIAYNGDGMEREKLEKLREALAAGFLPETRSIGIMNVSMRLRLIYGDTAELRVDSQRGEGTAVAITLPV